MKLFSIPNIITLGNLICGILGISFAFKNELEIAFYFIAIASILDFADGLAARLLNSYSPIGKQLDSLADVVSFGVLPGVIVGQLIAKTEGTTLFNLETPLSFCALLIPAFSALRLAKFNIDERQSESFIGLPTPANALFFAALPLLNQQFPEWFFLKSNYFYCVLTILFSFLLISEIKLFSLKFKSFTIAKNKARYFLLTASLILLILFSFSAVAFIILLYLISAIFTTLTETKQL